MYQTKWPPLLFNGLSDNNGDEEPFSQGEEREFFYTWLREKIEIECNGFELKLRERARDSPTVK